MVLRSPTPPLPPPRSTSQISPALQSTSVVADIPSVTTVNNPCAPITIKIVPKVGWGGGPRTVTHTHTHTHTWPYFVGSESYTTTGSGSGSTKQRPARHLDPVPFHIAACIYAHIWKSHPPLSKQASRERAESIGSRGHDDRSWHFVLSHPQEKGKGDKSLTPIQY